MTTVMPADQTGHEWQQPHPPPSAVTDDREKQQHAANEHSECSIEAILIVRKEHGPLDALWLIHPQHPCQRAGFDGMENNQKSEERLLTLTRLSS
jgi:hypothetical protein